MPSTPLASPIPYTKIQIPAELCVQEPVQGRTLAFAGDVRLGNLRGAGDADLLVYRSIEGAHDGGGMKPCFLGACTAAGEVLWRCGRGGEQPARPGPVTVYDIDGDGCDEVICFFVDPTAAGEPGDMGNVVVQIRRGDTGEVQHQSAPAQLRACTGSGPNWVHQRLLVANLQGGPRPRDMVVKLGEQIIALSHQLEVLWTYRIRWNEYGSCAAYIPAVGDIDGDGLDEVNGGYFLLDHDGAPRWEAALAPHMDSVAITEWDNGVVRAVCSGGGHVMDERGKPVLRLGEDLVPHGQEVRVARFLPDEPSPQMLIRHEAHTTPVMLVDTSGRVRRRFRLNPTPNNTGMEVVYWRGQDGPAALCNGGMLWDIETASAVVLPGLPEPSGPSRQGWYHCIPADLTGSGSEQVVLYNPWEPVVYVFGPHGPDTAAAPPTGAYGPGPRQFNARLMD